MTSGSRPDGSPTGQADPRSGRGPHTTRATDHWPIELALQASLTWAQARLPCSPLVSIRRIGRFTLTRSVVVDRLKGTSSDEGEQIVWAASSNGDGRATLDEVDMQLLSAERLAAVLDVSVRTLWRLQNAGKLPPSLRIGGSVRWNAAEIRSWIRAGCPPSPGRRRRP